jgi:hypothetical protein
MPLYAIILLTIEGCVSKPMPDERWWWDGGDKKYSVVAELYGSRLIINGRGEIRNNTWEKGRFEGFENISTVEIHKGITKIEKNVFKNSTNLRLVTIPNSVTYIGTEAFRGSGVVFVTLPAQMMVIRSRTFANCRDLTRITIPNTVTHIEEKAFASSGLMSVVIPNSVTHIGKEAFAGTDITSIVIPSSVISIGAEAFAYSKLKTVTISSGVIDIGKRAFGNCSNIVSINVDADNTEYSSINGVLFNKDKTVLIQYPTDKKDSVYIVPQSVKFIEKEAFIGNKNLTSITIPKNIWVESDAFSGSNLMSVQDGITVIGNYAFVSCKNSTLVTIPSSVTSIMWEMLGCTPTSINVADDNTEYSSIDGVLFNKNKTMLLKYPSGKKDRAYIIPNGVTAIKASICENLRTVTIPSSLTYISNNTLRCFNSDLISINVEDGNDKYSSIDGVLFNKDKTVLIQYPASKRDRTYTIPSSVTSIEKNAFSNCKNLLSVMIPNSVESIGKWAFYRCTSLTSVIIPNTVTSIGESAFANCTNLKSVTISNSVMYIGKEAFAHCVNLASINVEDGNDKYSSTNGVLFNKDKSHLIQYPASKLDHTYTIPNSVKSIGEFAFRGSSHLTSVIIPQSVTSIGEKAFLGCINLKSTTSINSIKEFVGCAVYHHIGLLSTIHNSLDFPKDGSLTGSRSRSDVQRVITQNVVDLRIQYSRRLDEKKSLCGIITVNFSINEHGKVISTQIAESTMNDLIFENIVIEKLRNWNFDKINKSGDVTEVMYPFLFLL